MLQTAMVPMLEATNEQIFADAQLLALIVRGKNCKPKFTHKEKYHEKVYAGHTGCK